MEFDYNLDTTKFQWIKPPVLSDNRLAILIPQFNEGWHDNFIQRLDYFNQLAATLDKIDVIIIDDGSTDTSFSQLVNYIDSNATSFFCASVFPNLQKVGALNFTASHIDHDYVILSDFDTDLWNLKSLKNKIKSFDEDDSLMGCYFKMIPHEGKGWIFLLQQLEYAFARIYYQLHRKEKSVPVMPGAGCCYKRSILLDIYARHSGLRNGEDREATSIGLLLGLKTVYNEDVLALTRPPLSFTTLVKQRKRWYLGYLETIFFQRKFFKHEVGKLSSIGLRTMQDFLSVLTLLLIPIELIVSIFFTGKFTLLLALATYLSSLGYYVLLFALNKKERTGLKIECFKLLLVYPLFWLSISFICWWQAIISFTSKNYKEKETTIPENIPRLTTSIPMTQNA